MSDTTPRAAAEMTSREMADAIGTDPKALRTFLRDSPQWNNAGQGGRYTFVKADVKPLKKQFAEWTKARDAKRAAKAAADATKAEKPAKVAKATSRPEPVETDHERGMNRVIALEARLADRGLALRQNV